MLVHPCPEMTLREVTLGPPCLLLMGGDDSGADSEKGSNGGDRKSAQAQLQNTVASSSSRGKVASRCLRAPRLAHRRRLCEVSS